MAIPMKTPRGGSFCKGYSLVDKRISLAYILLSAITHAMRNESRRL
jgi:hypothetical protein